MVVDKGVGAVVYKGLAIATEEVLGMVVHECG